MKSIGNALALTATLAFIAYAGYTGSICVKLYNHGKTDYKVNSGDKISQIVFIRVEHFDFYPCSKMPDRERGNAGFGSTGK